MSATAGAAQLYDGKGGVKTTGLDDAQIAGRGEDQLLWIDLLAPDDAELEDAAAAVGLEVETLRQLLDDGTENGPLDDQGETIGMHAFALERSEDGYDRAALNAAAGHNWVITSHGRRLTAVDEFQQRLATSRRVGALDGGSFIAFLLDWLFTRYMFEIEKIDDEIDELDLAILRDNSDDSSLETIATLRRRAAAIRRALSAHREVVSWPAHTDFSDVMTERAQKHFAATSERFGQAMASVDSTRDSLDGCFDLLMSRVAQRTNDTVRILTVVSVSLLPATLVTGVLGMNFHPTFFDHPTYFWIVLAVIVVVVFGVLAVARLRDWL
ncbi:MAG: magnesium transporter [Gaiellales bacterium]|jgi:magnesium/cobalt transport protein CorA|nr:magnesium transporter [Gaiellales bacterium]MDX6551001.1 magnesium transporter [Gaiellales bacterium]